MELSQRVDSSFVLINRAIEDIHSILLELNRKSFCADCNRNFFNAEAKAKLKDLSKIIEGE